MIDGGTLTAGIVTERRRRGECGVEKETQNPGYDTGIWDEQEADSCFLQ